MVVQEYVPGRDDALFSMHAYMDQDSRPLGVFTGQKVRTWPTHAGIGCFVRSVYVPELVEIGVDLLRRVRYTGLALLQFKRDARDGRYRLLEINARASSWNLLASACGVNLPYLAYRDAVGLPAKEPRRQKEGLRYVSFENDVRAFLDYRRHGEWTWLSWARSLVGRNVYQLLAWDDLKPFARDVASSSGPWRPQNSRERRERYDMRSEETEKHRAALHPRLERGPPRLLDQYAALDIQVSYTHFAEPLGGWTLFATRLGDVPPLPDLAIAPSSIIARDELAAVEWSYEGTHRDGNLFGVEPERHAGRVQGVTVYQMLDGRVVQERGVVDVLGLMAQLGALG